MQVTSQTMSLGQSIQILVLTLFIMMTYFPFKSEV